MTLEALSEFREKIAHSRRVFDNVKSEMSRVVVGHEKLIEEVLTAQAELLNQFT